MSVQTELDAPDSATSKPVAGRLEAAFSLPAATWTEFAAHAWERDTVVMPKVLAAPLVTSDEVLRTLLIAAEGCRAGKYDDVFTIWVGGKKLSEPMALLPETQDPSLQGYLERLHQRVGGAEFTILLANPHLYDEEIGRRTWRFLSGLFAHTGIPCGGTDTGLFLGRYTKTPFGVHRGQMSVMTFPVLGQKRFLLWPRGYGEQHADIRDSLAYDGHVAHAFERIAGAGDVMYWPADFWHIADDAIAYTAAFNIGFWWDRSPLQRAIYAFTDAVTTEAEAISSIDRMADGRGICLGTSDFAGPAMRQLPAELEAAMQIVQRACNGPMFGSIALAEWLRFRSSNGLRDLPDPAPVPPARTDALLVPIGPNAVVFSKNADGRLIVAANGRATVVADHLQVRATLVELMAGRPAAFAEAGALDTGGEAIAKRLIELMVTSRAAAIG
ncbi:MULTISPECIES: cupin domain-containing protein [unclassified Bradyrhizobium]|uniref:cupin domain-containing protein n=1 Tax=unclassified Bradyrhizobium TaxID=2631580 RepID=UPI002916D0BD|nr:MULTISPECIES: cupin domain-containing protein [unclassified Bradyrhizobium]